MTARYKGRRNAKAIERDFPHVVELAVPENGFGKRIDDIYAFHLERGIKPQEGQGRRQGERDLVRWCFADAETAAAFAARFGGVAVMPDDAVALVEWGRHLQRG